MPKLVTFDAVGGADVLKVVDAPARDPAPGEVRLSLSSIGLNRAEILYREGLYFQTPQFPGCRIGLEGVGRVDAVGEGVTGINEGDRFVTGPTNTMAQTGVYGQTVTVGAQHLLPDIPQFTDDELAALWVAYLTCYGPFVEIAGLQKGDYVLIAAASSSVGYAGIQIAKALGAHPIATSRTRAKEAALLEAGAEAVIPTDEAADLTAALMEPTGGAGYRLIFDPIGGAIVEPMAAALALNGHYVLYGLLDPNPTVYPTLLSFVKHMHFHTFMVPTQGIADRAMRDKGTAFLARAVANGHLKPKLDRIFELQDVRAAHTYMESNQQNGKIVMRA
ncbi:MAG: zinc-dependent alcohol dehydrogenase family protein [Pseudomonadota bacterium]